MEQIVWITIALVLGTALALGSTALSGLAIDVGLRDGRDDAQRGAVTLGISLVIGLVELGYVVLTARGAASPPAVLGVLGWALLVDAGVSMLGLLVATGIHTPRAQARLQEKLLEAGHRREMEASTLRLDTWREAARAREAPRAREAASTEPDPEAGTGTWW